MKRFILIILAVVILGGGAAGASIYFRVGPLVTLMKLKVPPKEPAAPPPPVHQEEPVGSFVIPIVQEHGIGRSFGLDIALDVLDSDKTKVEALLPRIQNAFTLTLYEIVPAHSDSHSAADKKLIHDRLKIAVDKVVGKGLVQDVIIKSVYDR